MKADDVTWSYISFAGTPLAQIWEDVAQVLMGLF